MHWCCSLLLFLVSASLASGWCVFAAAIVIWCLLEAAAARKALKDVVKIASHTHHTRLVEIEMEIVS